MALVYDNSKKSVEEYFALMQSDPDHRYEYIDGYIYMMSGGTKRHSTIGSNVDRILGTLLLESPCIVHNSDACVQVAETRFVCPDVTVSCDPRDQDNSDGDEFEVIKYPSLVVEVLSPSTKSIDQGDKLVLYLDVPTIQEYIVIDTKTPRVLLYRREEPDRWSVYIRGLEHEIELTSIGVHFPVADIYKKTRFAK
ncbi:MAG TPA: Uma2 family endonuclease [Ktedonobacteraceae bacterium]|jgi:Uma2 family endonuclease